MGAERDIAWSLFDRDVSSRFEPLAVFIDEGDGSHGSAGSCQQQVQYRVKFVIRPSIQHFERIELPKTTFLIRGYTDRPTAAASGIGFPPNRPPQT
jgi:hypothetical protein